LSIFYQSGLETYVKRGDTSVLEAESNA